VTNQISGVVAFPLLEYNEELLYFQPQVILEEVSLAHNGGAVLALSTHLIIVRSNISENELGIMGDSIYLTHSTVRKNRFWGIDLHLPSSVFSPQYLGALQNNEISENGVGVILGAIAEDAAGSWLRMDENKIVHNQEYGVMILKSVCPTSPRTLSLPLGGKALSSESLGGITSSMTTCRAISALPTTPGRRGSGSHNSTKSSSAILMSQHKRGGSHE
jgi:hypothetical protein